MARPQNLVEVARIARANASDFAMALDEFADEFYLDHPDKTAQQRRLDPIPEPVGDALIDAWIGAAGEHLAQRWGLRVPVWCYRPEHNALKDPQFYPPSRALRGVLTSRARPPSAHGFCSRGSSHWHEPDSLRECRGHKCRSRGRRPMRRRSPLVGPQGTCDETAALADGTIPPFAYIAAVTGDRGRCPG
jgi:hypothetical protein